MEASPPTMPAASSAAAGAITLFNIGFMASKMPPKPERNLRRGSIFCRNADADDRAAAVHALGADGPAVGLSDLPHDREPEAGSRPVAGRRRAVEALEDVGQVGRVDARAAVAHADLAVADGHVDGRPRRAPLRRVV